MSARNSTITRVLSFLDGEQEAKLRRQIVGLEDFDYRLGHADGSPRPGVGELTNKAFWSASVLSGVQIVLVAFSSRDLTELKRILDKPSVSRDRSVGFWSHLGVAVIAVLENDSIHDAVTAAQLDFDGILAKPFHGRQIATLLRHATERSDRRKHLAVRYDKLRALLRRTNHNRRYLRDKIDLLCRDLVGSNVDLTGTLHNLRNAYDFQMCLCGEFDMRMMLHKALRNIKGHAEESSAAVYLCHSGNFEAHVVSSWYDHPNEIATLEELLTETIIPGVLESRSAILVPNGGAWPDISESHRDSLSGLSLLAMPIQIESRLLGAVVLYRNADKPMTSRCVATIATMLSPLGHAIESLQKLEHLLV